MRRAVEGCVSNVEATSYWQRAAQGVANINTICFLAIKWAWSGGGVSSAGWTPSQQALPWRLAILRDRTPAQLFGVDCAIIHILHANFLHLLTGVLEPAWSCEQELEVLMMYPSYPGCMGAGGCREGRSPPLHS
eukprot:1148898-Pelagomonas_calceolata.AAC.4